MIICNFILYSATMYNKHSTTAYDTIDMVQPSPIPLQVDGINDQDNLPAQELGVHIASSENGNMAPVEINNSEQLEGACSPMFDCQHISRLRYNVIL